ncbi:MAG: DUF1499 domain-containing protein [Balneolales bacterium]|nr:DUF1499 domain-containing protein [Balneolales bacterium]
METPLTEQPEQKKENAFAVYFYQLLAGITVVIFLALVLSGYGYQWGIWSLSFAFAVLRISVYMLMVTGVIALLAFLASLKFFSKKSFMALSLVALMLSIATTSFALYWNYQGDSNPFLHDITTDTVNPPEFNAVLPARQNAPNPPEYAGEEVASLQKEAFPDLITIYLDAPFSRVYDEALALIGSRGWKMAGADRENGTIEATEKLPWFGFRDDVVIRLRDADGRTVVDMRSKSRVGGTDLGVNARRVKDFLSDLKSEVRSN